MAVAGAWALTSGIGPLETARTALFIAPLPRTEDLSLFPSSQLLSAKMGSAPKKGWGPGLTGSPDRIYLDAETQASDLPRRKADAEHSAKMTLWLLMCRCDTWNVKQ